MFEKKLVHGYDAHEVLYLYCVSGAWVRASGFTTGANKITQWKRIEVPTFPLHKGPKWKPKCNSFLPIYSLCALSSSSAPNHRTEISAFKKVVKQLLMHICQKFWENGIQRGFGMPAKDEKENGDEVEHNVVEWEEGIWHLTSENHRMPTPGEMGSNHSGTGRGQPVSTGWLPGLGRQ